MAELTEKQREQFALFNSGKSYLCFFGGARCLSGDAILDGYNKTVEELSVIGKPILVRTGMGFQWVKAPYKKGAGELLKVDLEDGKSCEVVPEHQFWDGQKWVEAIDLIEGKFIATSACNEGEDFSFVGSLQETNWEFSLSTLFSSVQRCLEKHEDYWGDYFEYYHQCGQRLPSFLAFYLTYHASQCGEQGRSLFDTFFVLLGLDSHIRYLDELAEVGSQTYLSLSPPSSSHDFDLINHKVLFESDAFLQIYELFLGLFEKCPKAQWGLSLPVSAQLTLNSFASRFSPFFFHASLFSYKQPVNFKLSKVINVTCSAVKDFYNVYVPNDECYYANGILHHNSGKTFGTVLHILSCALAVPESNYLICRKHLSDAVSKIYEETFKDVVREFFPALEYKYRGQPYYTIELPNGSNILFGGLSDDDRIDKILGREYTKIFFNEASEIGYRAYTTALSRLAQKNVLTKQFILDLNPVANNHWVYRLFVEGVEPSTGRALIGVEDYLSLQMNPSDNIRNIDRDFLKRLDNAPEGERRRFLYGEWSDAGDVVVVKPEWFRRYERIPSYNYVVQTWDTAQKDSDFNDFSAGLTWGVGQDGYYLLDIVNKRMDYPTLKRFIYEYANRWRADEVVIEDKASGISLIQDLKVTTHLPIRAFNPKNTGKTMRMATAAQYFEKGMVFIPREHDNLDEYISQLVLFPNGDNDDLVDATSMFLLFAQDRLWLERKELDIYEEDDENREDYYIAARPTNPSGY